MSDLISRQDAIDALGEEPLVWDENDDYDVATRNQWIYDVECIKEVPSAEPDIVQCKDCKHRGGKPIADGRYWCERHGAYMYYCSDAERKTNGS